MAHFSLRRTRKRHLSFAWGEYAGMFDKAFCSRAEFRDFTEQADKLMDRGRVLKNDRACCVSRVRCNGRDVVVKRYVCRGLYHSLRHTIKKSRARRGWLWGHALLAMNIPTPRPLAWIEQRKNGLVRKSYLVTEHVEGPNLYHFLRDETFSKRDRWTRAAEALELVKRMGQYHISHGDMKHSNILVAENGITLTDLDSVKRHRFSWTYDVRQAKDMARFLRATDIPAALQAHRAQLISRQANAIEKNDNDFVQIRTGDWLILFQRDFGKDAVTDLISAVTGPTENQKDLKRVPSSDHTRVFRFGLSIEGKTRVFYLKRYLARSVFDRLKHVLRPSRARRAFEASRMLQRNGFDCPDVVALFERRRGPLHADNLLLTEDVGGCMALCDYLAGPAGAPTAEALSEKRRLISLFGETVGRMHAKGIFHGDLRLGNILVRKDDKGWRFFMIDNERTKRFCRLPLRLRCKNLVQVNMGRDGISNSDRMRFFNAYADANILAQGRHKKWARRIADRTRNRLLKKEWFDG